MVIAPFSYYEVQTSRYNLTNDQLDKLNKQIRKRAQILLND